MIDAKLAALVDRGHQQALDTNPAPEMNQEFDPDPAPGFNPDGTRYTDADAIARWKAIEEAAARLPELEAEAQHLPD